MNITQAFSGEKTTAKQAIHTSTKCRKESKRDYGVSHRNDSERADKYKRKI